MAEEPKSLWEDENEWREFKSVQELCEPNEQNKMFGEIMDLSETEYTNLIIRTYDNPEQQMMNDTIIELYYKGVPKEKEMLCVVDYMLTQFRNLKEQMNKNILEKK